MYKEILECVPEPGQGEHMADPGRDEYPEGHGVKTDLRHLLPWGHVVHDVSVSLAIYIPS